MKILFILTLSLSADFAQAAGKILWNNWYTVSVVNPQGKTKTPVMYFNEKLERDGNKLKIEVHIWKKQDGIVMEEHTGAFAEDTKELRPLFYSFQQTSSHEGRTSKLSIDGMFDAKGKLNAKVRQDDKPTGAIAQQIPKGVILSVFFPVWFSKNMGEISQLPKPVRFSTIQEDAVEKNFSIETGTVKIQKPDSFAKSNNVVLADVFVHNTAYKWYFKNTGEALRIEIPAAFMEMTLSDEKTAKAFLQ